MFLLVSAKAEKGLTTSDGSGKSAFFYVQSRNLGVDLADVRVITYLYWGQKAVVMCVISSIILTVPTGCHR
jgi:hypothetical protein